MRKSKKVLIIIIGVIIGVILIDSIQALVFNNKPILKLVKDISGGNLVQYNKGILVDNYICVDGTRKTVFKWKKYACESIKVKIYEKSDIEIEENNGVILKLKDGTLNKYGISAILENNSNFTVAFGEGMGLQKFQNGDWYNLELIHECVVHLILYNLQPGTSKELKDGFGCYGELTPGKYRLIKRVSFVYENDESEDFYVAAEFTID